MEGTSRGPLPNRVRWTERVGRAVVLSSGCAVLGFFWLVYWDWGSRGVGGQGPLWWGLLVGGAALLVAVVAVGVVTRRWGWLGLLTTLVWVEAMVDLAWFASVTSYGLCFPYVFAVVLAPLVLSVRRRRSAGHRSG